MPELSRFYGIIIYMYVKDHTPPHFHARYGEFLGLVSIETGNQVEGNLPKRAMKLIKEWMELHKEELTENWGESQKDNPHFSKIEPLK